MVLINLLLLSKLTHLILSFHSPNENRLDYLDSIVDHFLLNGKLTKICREILVAEVKYVGLNLHNMPLVIGKPEMN